MKFDKELISADAIRILLKIRTAIYNGEIKTLNTSVFAGEFAVCNKIEQIINDALALESMYQDAKLQGSLDKRENEKYGELFSGLAPDDLTDKQAETMKQMTEQWARELWGDADDE